MIVEEKLPCSEEKMRLESFGAIAIDGQMVLESTRNNNDSLENSTVDDEIQDISNNEKVEQQKIENSSATKSNPPKSTKTRCKYKRQLCRITRILQTLNNQTSPNNCCILRNQKNGQSDGNPKLISHMMMAELQHMCRQQLVFLCAEKQFGFRKENQDLANCGRKDQQINKNEPQKQMVVYHSSSENSDDFVVAVYEDKLAKYRRYIELLNLEHNEQLQKYDIKFEQRVGDLEQFFQARENDLHFDYDLKIKEIMLEQKQKMSTLENKFKQKLEEQINVYVRKLDNNQQKYVDTVQHFKNEIKHREQHVAALTSKFSTLLELKDKFLSYYNSMVELGNGNPPPPSSLLAINRPNLNDSIVAIKPLLQSKKNPKCSLTELQHVRQVLRQFLSTQDQKIKEQLLVIISNMLDFFAEYTPPKQ